MAFIIPYFYPAWQYGGPPRSAYELARGLVRRGHHVRVLTTDSAGNSRIPEVEMGKNGHRDLEGIEVVYYRNVSNYLAYRHRLFCPPRFFREVRERLADCDIIHIHELRSMLTVSAFSAARDLSLPYVLSPHGGLRYLGKRALKVIFDWAWGRAILMNASAVLAVSPLEEEEARHLRVEASRIKPLPNPISTDDYLHLPQAGAFRARWNIGQRKLVLFLGRLHWIKGVDLLVEAFARLRLRMPDARLALAGPDDGQEPELRRLVARAQIGDRVTFTGFLSHEEKLEAFVDSDLIVIPSRSEIFAITAIEALMCGTPVLLSSSCGLSAAAGPERGILRFHSEDVEDLVTKLSIVLDGGFKQNAVNGRDFVSQEFSASIVAQKAELVYEEISRV